MKLLFAKFSITLLAVLLLAPVEVTAAELVMFEQAGCPWCERFNREIGPLYSKTDEGQRAPLRREELTRTPPADLSFITLERLTPLFVLVDSGREIGRIRGYPGEANFWGMLDALIARLDAPASSAARSELFDASPLRGSER